MLEKLETNVLELIAFKDMRRMLVDYRKAFLLNGFNHLVNSGFDFVKN